MTFEIVKATAPAIEWPEVTGGLTYGQTVVEIPLSAMEDDHGAFVWKCPDCLPGVGEFLFPLVYMPDNADNYDYTGVHWNVRYASKSCRRTSPRSPWTPSPRRRRRAAPLPRP